MAFTGRFTIINSIFEDNYREFTSIDRLQFVQNIEQVVRNILYPNFKNQDTNSCMQCSYKTSITDQIA